MSRIFDFAFTDRKYRFTAYLLSGTIALICALVCRLFFRWDERDVLLMAAIILCSFAALFILYYVFVRKAPALEFTAPAWPSLRLTAPILAIVVAGFLGISVQTNIIPKVQASIVDLRLASLDKTITHSFAMQSSEQAQALLRTRFQKLQSIAEISYNYQVPVDLNTLNRTEATIQALLKQPTLSSQTKQVGLIASAKLVDLSALRKTEANTGPPLSYVINSTVEISGKNIRFKGDNSTMTMGGDFFIHNSTVVFDGINFRAEQPFTDALYFQDPASTIIVRDSTIENLDQTLDHATWVNVRFQHSRIKLRGGGFALINVSFIDCDLQWLNGPVASDLQERITQAKGQPITFAFEGFPEHTRKPE